MTRLRGSIAGRGKQIFLLPKIVTVSETQPAFYSIDIGGLIRRDQNSRSMKLRDTLRKGLPECEMN